MASKSTLSSLNLKKTHEEESDAMSKLSHKFTLLKRQIQSERVASIGEKLAKNRQTIHGYVSEIETLAASRTDFTITRSNDQVNFLSLRMENPPCKFSGLIQSSEDRDDVSNEEVVFSATARLPLVEKLPPYTTWIFLDRNQRMADDQSVAGRRRIYYDQHGGEALICSDSEEELGDLEGEKHEFSAVEDRMLRVAFQECGVGDEVLDALTQFVGGTPSEIQERCNMLREKDRMIEKQDMKSSREEGSKDIVLLTKSLSTALDSFDNLFCRRCLVFDCRLHGCSQNLIHPSEKQTYGSDPEEDSKPCGDQCYIMDLLRSSVIDPFNESPSKALVDEDRSVFPAYPVEQESQGKHKAPELAPDDLVSSSCKKIKLVVPNPVDRGTTSGDQVPELDGSNECELKTSTIGASQMHNEVAAYCRLDVPETKAGGEDIDKLSLKQACNSSRSGNEWKPFEKDLYIKGLEIFGRNSCLIARNLLSGLKTCKEVSSYMYGDDVVLPRGSSAMLSMYLEDGCRADMENVDPEMPSKSRICRKRGRTRKLKSSWKSAGHPSLWKRVADGKDQPFKQYVPCGCESLCGKQCSCLLNGLCCEKYCGCSQSCKNRFRGCHCAKSQCKSRQCPCFAAGRECDPDVCRNCWVSCGDGSLGEPPRRGDSQCGNMKLLLRQQQRILLAKSDVAGWGAFLKNSVNKNEYLGEYTGELISHREADKRGKIYDRANSSFLFDLNDQYVLDAYRKGDKLKFANHSSTPNCYAKVMLVAGDHRVGIFANERIEAGEELFYDYRYGPDQAPAWARKPEGSKRDDLPVSHGRAKKHQSG